MESSTAYHECLRAVRPRARSPYIKGLAALHHNARRQRVARGVHEHACCVRLHIADLRPTLLTLNNQHAQAHSVYGAAANCNIVNNKQACVHVGESCRTPRLYHRAILVVAVRHLFSSCVHVFLGLLPVNII